VALTMGSVVQEVPPSALVLALGAGCILLADRVVNGQIDYQESRNEYLSKNIKQLDKQVKALRNLKKRRDQLIDRMRVIQELQGNRPIIVRVLDQMVRTVPDGVFYTGIKSKGKKISVSGIAESNNRVSSLMRRLDGSEWLANPNLDKVTAASKYGEQANKFNLSVKVQAPAADKQAEEG